MNETMRCMHRHVSVRAFQDRPLEPGLLDRLIACGQAASTSSFIQAYSVIRVRDRANRERIAEAAGNQAWIVSAPEFLVFCADLKRIEYCCKKSGQGEIDGYTEHFLAASVDTALMAQNVLLAAESVGLGGVFIGGIRNDPATVSACLELPRLVYPVFGMCLGWPDQRHAVKPRMPLDDILHDDRYRAAELEQRVDDYDRVMRAYYASRGSNRRVSDWSEQSAKAVQGKKREHMLDFLRGQGFLLR